MMMTDSKKGKSVMVEIRDSSAWVANAKGEMKERTKRFNQEFWDDMVPVFSSSDLRSIEHLRPLSPSEKFAKIKAGYQTYNGPRGSASQWKRAAESVLGGIATTNEYLELLGLDIMPQTKKALRKAWLRALKKEHPDMGGSVQVSQLINDAFEKLSAEY